MNLRKNQKKLDHYNTISFLKSFSIRTLWKELSLKDRASLILE